MLFLFSLENTHLSYFLSLIGINSPQALKKILSLSEEGSLERHKKQAEDTISNASSQLSSPPTSPQSSPRKGKAKLLTVSLYSKLYISAIISCRVAYYIIFDVTESFKMI